MHRDSPSGPLPEPVVASPTVDFRVRRAIAVIEASPDRRVDWKGLADSVGSSLSGLRFLFKSSTGLSPSRFLKRLRLERARVLLCSGCLSVKEVMAAVGCNDESHFVRDFEKTYGLSPKRYRQQNSLCLGEAVERNGQQSGE